MFRPKEPRRGEGGEWGELEEDRAEARGEWGLASLTGDVHFTSKK